MSLAISTAAFRAVSKAMSLAGNLVYYNRDSELTGTYNVDEGDFESGTPPAAFIEVIGRGYCDAYTVREINETTVITGDLKCYAEVAGGYVPQINDTARHNGINYRIMTVNPIFAESGIIVLYILQLRE